MSGRVQSIQINNRHPHLLCVKSKIAPSMKEGTYTIQLWMKKRDASINHAMCPCPAGWVNNEFEDGVYQVMIDFDFS